MTRSVTLVRLRAAVVVATAPAPAHAATCKPPTYPGSGYFISLKVTKVSCATGKSVALAFHKCRTKHGISGRCTSRVKGYSCRESRQTIATEIDGTVTCRNGSKKVVLKYQQNT